MTMHSLGWSRFEGKDEKHLVKEVKGIMTFLDSLSVKDGKVPTVTVIFEDNSFLLLSTGGGVWCYHSLMEGADNNHIAHRVGVTAKYGKTVLS